MFIVYAFITITISCSLHGNRATTPPPSAKHTGHPPCPCRTVAALAQNRRLVAPLLGLLDQRAVDHDSRPLLALALHPGAPGPLEDHVPAERRLRPRLHEDGGVRGHAQRRPPVHERRLLPERRPVRVDHERGAAQPVKSLQNSQRQ